MHFSPIRCKGMKTLETEVNSAEKFYKYMYSPLKTLFFVSIKKYRYACSLVQRPWQCAALLSCPKSQSRNSRRRLCGMRWECRSIQYPNWEGFFG